LDDYYIRPIAEVCDRSPEREDTRSDDDFLKLLEVFLDSDIIIISTPIYWQGLSAQLKCFIDRMSSYWRRPLYNIWGTP
jgi:multimeric flavodoxin WrbA